MSSHATSLRRIGQGAIQNCGRRHYVTIRRVSYPSRTTAPTGQYAAAGDNSISESTNTTLKQRVQDHDALRVDDRYKGSWQHKQLHLQKQERSDLFAMEKLGPLSPEAAKLFKTFQAGGDPFEALRLHLISGSVDIHVLRVCLLAARRQIFQIPRQERLKHYCNMEFKLARTVLGKIWEDPSVWFPLVRADYNATWSLCWFAAAEGLDGLILEWIKVEDPQVRQIERDTYGTEKSSIWRANLLSRLVNTLAHLGEGSADRALTCFLEFVEWKESSQTRHRVLKINSDPTWNWSDDIRVMSLRPAFLDIVGLLCTGYHHRTDPKLWSAIIAQRPRFIRTGDAGRFEAQIDVCRLHLYHPSEPSAEYLLNLIRQTILKSSGGHKPAFVDPSLLPVLEQSMLRAHIVTTARQQHEETSLISQTYMDLFGKPIDPADLPRPKRRLPPRLESRYIG